MDLFLESQFYSSDINVCPYASTHCFVYCSFVVGFEVECMSPPTLFFSFKIVLIIRGPLQICMNFMVSLSISAEKAIKDLMEKVLSKHFVLFDAVIIWTF